MRELLSFLFELQVAVKKSRFSRSLSLSPPPRLFMFTDDVGRGPAESTFFSYLHCDSTLFSLQYLRKKNKSIYQSNQWKKKKKEKLCAKIKYKKEKSLTNSGPETHWMPFINSEIWAWACVSP